MQSTTNLSDSTRAYGHKRAFDIMTQRQYKSWSKERPADSSQTEDSQPTWNFQWYSAKNEIQTVKPSYKI